MIEAINLKAGMTFEQNGKLIKVLASSIISQEKVTL